jgi:hypothetical protein
MINDKLKFTDGEFNTRILGQIHIDDLSSKVRAKFDEGNVANFFLSDDGRLRCRFFDGSYRQPIQDAHLSKYAAMRKGTPSKNLKDSDLDKILKLVGGTRTGDVLKFPKPLFDYTSYHTSVFPKAKTLSLASYVLANGKKNWRELEDSIEHKDVNKAFQLILA